MSKRSLILIGVLFLSGVVLVLACRNRNVTSAQAETTAAANQPSTSEIAPLTDKSAEVAVTLPYFHRLDDNYIRGALPTKGGVKTLHRLGIKTVVDLRSIYDHTDEIGLAVERLGLKYYWLPTSVWDPPTDARAKEFVKLVSDNSQGPFYVFCADGLNRVGEMSAIYRVAKSQWTVEQALKEIDEFGFNPYYWNLRAYVFTYARKFHPKSLPPQARSLSSMEAAN
ncbi:MAG: hypothetical protein HY231_02210 [Acidobacteria bacterium]|nr:hypothetical protein [Acidobacteriota bacterium]